MNRTNHARALALYTGQTARTRADHTHARCSFLVCRTDTRDGRNLTHIVSQHTTEAAALAELARLQQADPAGRYSAWQRLGRPGGGAA